MALEQITFNLGALDDAANSGKNYVAGQVFEVFNIDDTYADIFADSAGTIPIDQSGIQNISNSDGECKFFINKGFYNIKSGGKVRQLNANFSFEFKTVSDAVNARFISLLEGRRVWLTDRQAWFDVVLTSTITVNGFNAIQSNSNSTYSFYLSIDDKWVKPENLGAIPANDNSSVFAFMESVAPWVILNPVTYKSSTTVNFIDQKVIGFGYTKSRIENISGSTSIPAVTLQGRTAAFDFQAGFPESDLTGTEFAGQRIAFLFGGTLALQRTKISVQANFCGTGFASLQSLEGSINNAVFSVTFDHLQAQNFTFRGLDFDTTTRTGNVYQNIFCQTDDSRKFIAPYDSIDCGIRIAGLENESTFGQLNVERVKCVRAFDFENLYGISGGSLHIEDIDLTSNYNGAVRVNNVSGKIGAVSAINLPINIDGWHILDCNDSTYDGSAARDEMVLTIGSLHAKRLNRTVGLTVLTDFNFIRRDPAGVGNFKLVVESFAWQSAATTSDVAIYEAFPVADNNMKLTLGWAQPTLVQAFSAVISNPDLTASVSFSTPQTDLNYRISMSSNLNRNYWWSNKSVNGFDVNFDTTPLTTGTIEGLIVRED